MSYETNSTNLLTLNNEPFPSTQQPQPQQQQSTSSPDAKQISKLILRSALQKANAAVQCDSTNDVLGAINAYKEAILLLERVLSTVDKENDRRRLQEIVSFGESKPSFCKMAVFKGRGVDEGVERAAAAAVMSSSKLTLIVFIISMTHIQREFDF